MERDEHTTEHTEHTEHTEPIEGTEPTEPTEQVEGLEETPAEQTTWFSDWQAEQAPQVEEQAQEHAGPLSGLHPLQIGYLVAGLLALGGALQWLLIDRGALELGDGSVALSALLVAAGTVGLVASLGRALRHR